MKRVLKYLRFFSRGGTVCWMITFILAGTCSAEDLQDPSYVRRINPDYSVFQKELARQIASGLAAKGYRISHADYDISVKVLVHDATVYSTMREPFLKDIEIQLSRDGGELDVVRFQRQGRLLFSKSYKSIVGNLVKKISRILREFSDQQEFRESQNLSIKFLD
ncbi:MAG: hypothetical protein KC900_07710 [Candidatus Omnitrophica bacterium]|nr:hypothetical protein [Candidatus Omnitrophota bacterium]